MLLKRLGIILAALIPVAIVGAFVFQGPEEKSATSSTTATTTTPTEGGEEDGEEDESGEDDEDDVNGAGNSAPIVTNTPVTGTPAAYTNGTFTADGAYRSPMGNELITVRVTIDADIVTAVEVVPHGTGASALWQEKFAAGIEAAVAGKRLENLRVTNVSGSSLTPIGFNAALDAIRTQAQG